MLLQFNSLIPIPLPPNAMHPTPANAILIGLEPYISHASLQVHEYSTRSDEQKARPK